VLELQLFVFSISWLPNRGPLFKNRVERGFTSFLYVLEV
jgi:hypothetical protein